MSAELATKILRRAGVARDARVIHEQVWRECLEHTWPELAHGLGGQIVDAASAQQRVASQIDSTGRDAAQTFVAGLIGGLVPANARWFELDVGSESEDEKRWLGASADLIWENIHVANFDGEALDAFRYMAGAGWFPMLVEERDEGGYLFTTLPIAGVYVAASRAGGRVDTAYICREMRVEQLVAQYGLDAVSPKTREAFAAEKFGDKVRITWAIYPRELYVAGPAFKRNKRFASVIVEDAEKHVIDEGGFDEFPLLVPRWMVIPGTDYATGKVRDALPDMKTLNQLAFNELAATDLAVAGMWKATDDGVLNPTSVKVGPRKIIAVADIDNMQPLLTGSDFKVGWTVRADLQASIRRTLLADQLQPQDKPQMTAYEVHVRVNVIRQLLGPIFGRMQSEFLQPLIERCFAIAARAGVLGEPPASLANRNYTVRYVSPLARAQRLEEVTATEQWLTTIANWATTKQDMAVFDIVDEDAAARRLAEGRGVPLDLLRKAEDIQAIRDARAQAAQEARQQAQAEDMEVEAAKAGMQAQARAA